MPTNGGPAMAGRRGHRESPFSFAGRQARLRDPFNTGGPISANENHLSTFRGENIYPYNAS